MLAEWTRTHFLGPLHESAAEVWCLMKRRREAKRLGSLFISALILEHIAILVHHIGR
ncbi:uncharacterized protein BDW70DRAFT_134891 [Aspergillus foveolatus]|uniref:uncharacterized protein n=1 Tax=Aspergillus foveolatus TaxID=210207 RepID=UPI003CCE4AE5